MRKFIINLFTKKRFKSSKNMFSLIAKRNEIAKQKETIKQLENILLTYKQAFELKRNENNRLELKCNDLKKQLENERKKNHDN